jgi:hypothetical protein
MSHEPPPLAHQNILRIPLRIRRPMRDTNRTESTKQKVRAPQAKVREVGKILGERPDVRIAFQN